MCKICDEYWSSAKETTMKNATVTMEVTPEEALLIQKTRGIQERDEQFVKSSTNPPHSSYWLAEYLQKYMEMTDDEFMNEYRNIMGDDYITDKVMDSLEVSQMLEVIWLAVCKKTVERGADALHHLFYSCVPKREQFRLFLETHDREKLAFELIDFITSPAGRWAQERFLKRKQQ